MGAIVLTGDHYTVDNLFQWDKNQVLEIRGLNLAFKPEIHFTNHTMDRAIVRQSSVNDAGIITTIIPNSLLQVSYPIKVYVCGYEGQTFKTYYTFTIPIVGREKPKDYNLQNDEEVYSFNRIEHIVNNFNYDILQTVRSWIENSLTANKSGRILDAYQGKVLLDRIENEEKKSGVLSDLIVDKKDNIVSAINSVVTIFNEKIGELAKLTTGSKDNIVTAINELVVKINTHDHDRRYYTETEIDTKTGNFDFLNTTEKTNIVGSINEVLKGLTDHKTSTDHDKRYHTKTEIKNMIGLLTDLTTKAKSNIVGAINEVLESLNTHKTSTDHDERYYQKTEVDQVLTGKQDTLIIVDDVTSTDTTAVLSANQGKVLNDKIVAVEDNFKTITVPAGVGNDIKLKFDRTFSAILSVTTETNGSNTYIIQGRAGVTNQLEVVRLAVTSTDTISITPTVDTLTVTISVPDHKEYYVSLIMIGGSLPSVI